MATLDPKMCDSKAVSIALLQSSPRLKPETQSLMTAGLITGVVAAEAGRRGNLEGFLEGMSWLTGFYNTKIGGVGPGQIYTAGHTDVCTELKTELAQFVSHLNTNCGKSLKLSGFPNDVTDETLADFFIAGLLALKVNSAQKAGRTPDDALQYGIGLYGGGRASILAAQTAIGKGDPGTVVDYLPVKNHLLASKDPVQINVAAYIHEVYSSK